MTVEERLEALEQERQAARVETAALRAELQAVQRWQRQRVTPGTALLLLAVLALTALCGSRAYAVASTPSHSEFTVTADPESASTPWSLPVVASPVTVTGTVTAPPTLKPATGFVHITRTSDNYLSWAGVHASTNSTTGPGVSSGYANADNREIVDVAIDNFAEIRSHLNGQTIQLVVHNNQEAGGFAVTVAIEMTW
jgi:hypothetical protein